MFRGVRARLAATHLLVACSSVALAAGLGSYLFSTRYVAQRRDELVSAASNLAFLSEDLLRNQDRAGLVVAACAAGEALGARVCIFDAHDALLAASYNRPVAAAAPSVAGESATAQYPLLETVIVECQGLTYSVTAPVRDGSSGELLGMVLVRCPIAGVTQMLSAQRASAAVSAAGAALLALALGIAAARALSVPLLQIAVAARQLAAGAFSVRVAPGGPTEIAALAGALNWSAERLAALFSELSAARSELADVLGSMSDGVVALDPEGRVLLANAQAAELLGIPGGLPEGRLLEELPLEPEVAAALLEGTGETTLRVGQRDLRLRLSGLTEGEGKVAVVIDVTEAARLERARRDFFANASHQLRTPLTSVRGYLEALADRTADTPEAAERCLAVALDQVALLQRLVGQLLELSRLQAGAQMPERKLVDLVEVADRACNHLKPQAASRRVELVVRADDGSMLVDADPDLLVQAVHNILDNAIRHSPESATVELAVAVSDGQAVLAVTDQGPGFAQDEAEDLWARFSRGERSGGAGLGLAITREIAEAHGGRVFADAPSGGGAVFGFVLPLAEPTPVSLPSSA